MAISTSTPADEFLFLIAERDAANQQRHVELVARAVFLELLSHLGGEFACRLEDQRAGHARLGAALTQLVDHRQDEGSGLACAGLGDARNIATAQDGGDTLFLDRGRGRVSSALHGCQDTGVETELVKRHQVGLLGLERPGHERNARFAGTAGAIGSPVPKSIPEPVTEGISGLRAGFSSADTADQGGAPSGSS